MSRKLPALVDKTERVVSRISPATRRALETAATAKGISLSREIEERLAASIAKSNYCQGSWLRTYPEKKCEKCGAGRYLSSWAVTALATLGIYSVCDLVEFSEDNSDWLERLRALPRSGLRTEQEVREIRALEVERRDRSKNSEEDRAITTILSGACTDAGDWSVAPDHWALDKSDDLDASTKHQ